MSRTLTIPDHLYDRLAAEARSDGLTSVEEWLQKLAAAKAETSGAAKIGHALDEFMGDWSASEQASFLDAVSVFDQIDESLWK